MRIRRALPALVAALLVVAAPATPALALTVVGISVGGGEVGVSLPGGGGGGSSSAPPLVGVTLPSGNVSEAQNVGVSVAGKPIVSGSVTPPTATTPGEASQPPPSEGAREGSSPPASAGSTPPSSSPPSGSSTGGGTAHAASAGQNAAPASGSASTGTNTGAVRPPRSAPATHDPATARAQKHNASSSSDQASVALANGTPAPANAGASARRAPSLAPVAKRTAQSSASASPLSSLGKHIPLPLPVPDWSKPIIVLLLLVAASFAIRAQLASRRARRLERQRKALQRDIGAMQAALVPAVPATLGGLAVSVAYRPADGPAAGGDFYDVFAPAPDRVAIILGDVAGHGHGALTRAALTRYTLRAYLQAGMEPRAALALAGRALADTSGEGLATVAVAVYDATLGTLTYALAGHPPPLVQAPVWSPAEPPSTCCSPPLGWSEPTGRRQTTLALPAGANVCFFSDGLTEARCEGDDGSILLGRTRLEALLADLGDAPQAADLLAAVTDAAATTPDDMAACVVRCERAVAAPARVEELLEVDGHTLAPEYVRRFLAECGLAAAQVDDALAQASATVAACGAAVVRVGSRQGAVRIDVEPPPTSAPLAHSGAGDEAAVAETLSPALSAG